MFDGVMDGALRMDANLKKRGDCNAAGVWWGGKVGAGYVMVNNDGKRETQPGRDGEEVMVDHDKYDGVGSISKLCGVKNRALYTTIYVLNESINDIVSKRRIRMWE